jgi:hypothetical protein
MSKKILEIPAYRRVYRALLKFGSTGATAYELSRAMGDSVKGYQVSSKLTELARHKLVKQEGSTADPSRQAKGTSNSNVWVALSE